MFPDLIKTNRLHMQPVHKKMTPRDLYKYCSDENENIDDLTESIHWNKHKDILKTIKVLSNMRDDWVNGKAAHYHIQHNNNSDFVGLCSLDIDYNKKQAEIGIWIRKKYWGRGISKERAFALIELGFDLLDLSSIIIVVSEKNEKSQSAVEKYISQLNGDKCGTIPDHHISESGKASDAIYYSLTKEQYESNKNDDNSVIDKINWTPDK